MMNYIPKTNLSWKRRGPQEQRWALIEVCPSNGWKRPQLCFLFWPAEHTSAFLSFKLWGGKSDIWGALYKTRSAKDLLYHLKSLCQSLESCHLAGRYRQATGWQVGINEKSMTAAEAEMGGKRERETERGWTEEKSMEVFVSYEEMCWRYRGPVTRDRGMRKTEARG